MIHPQSLTNDSGTCAHSEQREGESVRERERRRGEKGEGKEENEKEKEKAKREREIHLGDNIPASLLFVKHRIFDLTL